MKASSKPKIAVVGGGVVGLACAWRLAQRGGAVTLYERGLLGRGASGVAGGMLAATLESEEAPPALGALMRASLDEWPAFARALEMQTGTDIALRAEGTLLVSSHEEALRRRQARLPPGARVQWLDRAALRALEPNIAADCALHAKNDIQVDNRRLIAALAQACALSGVTLHEYAPIREVILRAGAACGVAGGDIRQEADYVVVAAGAWSAALGLEAFAAIRPVKGQILTLGMDGAAPLLRHVVWGDGAYLVPRRDGRLIVGASVEPDAGFDEGLSAEVLDGLRAAASRFVPATADLPRLEARAGLRPGPAHVLPLIGRTQTPGLVAATGHYRNGILLTPLTASRVAEAVFAL